MRFLIPAFLLVVVAAYLYLRPESLTLPAGPVDERATARDTKPGNSGLLSTEAAHLTQPGAPSASQRAPARAGLEPESKVSRDAIEQFVAANGHSAPSLLAAWSESRDRMWLREAAGKYPTDPAVQYFVLIADVFPAERTAWLQRLRDSSPRNGLADFLQAADELSAGERDAALATLRAGAAKPDFDDFSMAILEARAALMAASFRDPQEAGIRAMSGLPLESVPLVFKSAGEVLAGQKTALEQKDFAAATDAAALSVNLGRALNDADGKRLLIQQLAGISIEERALIALSSYPGAENALGFNPEERLAQLHAQRDEIKTLTSLLDPQGLDRLRPRLPEYLQRVRSEGELKALRWLTGGAAGK